MTTINDRTLCVTLSHKGEHRGVTAGLGLRCSKEVEVTQDTTRMKKDEMDTPLQINMEAQNHWVLEGNGLPPENSRVPC